MTESQAAPSTMSNEDLLAEYSSLQRWAGDDFSIEPFSDAASDRSQDLRTEILRRMSLAQPRPTGRNG